MLRKIKSQIKIPFDIKYQQCIGIIYLLCVIIGLLYLLFTV